MKAGDPAPDFTAAVSGGGEFRLFDALAEAEVLLYFFPKSFTPL